MAIREEFKIIDYKSDKDKMQEENGKINKEQNIA